MPAGRLISSGRVGRNPAMLMKPHRRPVGEIPGSVLLLGVPTIRADKPSLRLRFRPTRQQIGTATANLAHEAAQRGIASEGQSSQRV
jgi:hypothetical protein